MTSRAASLALALTLTLLCSRGSSAAPLPVSLAEALRQSAEATRLSLVVRVADIDEAKSKQAKEGAAVVSREGVEDGKQPDSGKSKDVKEEQAKGDRTASSNGKLDSAKRQGDGKGDKEKKRGAIPDSKGVGDGNNSTKKDDGALSDGIVKNMTKPVEEDESDDERSRIGRMTTSEMIAEARAHSNRLMKGGFIEFIEWLFVLILVAPGTFPAIGCILLSCSSFWRRRLANSNTSVVTPSPETVSRSVGGNTQSMYQRVSHGDHGALVVRARVKGGSDERDSDVL